MESVKAVIVDDHAFFRRTLRDFLAEQTGLEVIAEAEDGEEAVELTDILRPGLVIMDVMMPRVDGLTACRLIKRSRPETKVILYSINDPSSYGTRGTEAGAERFLSKQDLFEQLMPAVRELFPSPPAPHSVPGKQAPSKKESS